MSLKTQSYCLVIFLAMSVSASRAQLFTDQGLFSGSGFTVLPTATIAPNAEFRFQYGRLDYLKPGLKGANIMSLSSGFSSNIEAYVRLTGEQTGTLNSQVEYSFGGKFQLPVAVPVVRRLAFWMESTLSDASAQPALIPSEAFRTAAIATFDSNGIRPTLMIGLSEIKHNTHPLLGAGIMVAVNHRMQVGIETVHGYLDEHSTQSTLNAAVRLLPNVSLHLNPGYLSTSSASTWTLALGISLSTADVDFHQVEEEKASDEFTLPSLEEIEKQLNQKPESKDSLHDNVPKENTQPSDSLHGSVNKESQFESLSYLKEFDAGHFNSQIIDEQLQYARQRKGIKDE